MNRQLLLLIALVMLLAACNSAPLIDGDPSPPGPSASVAEDDGALREAIAFRRNFGLRSDEAWVRRVAADPNANTEYGVPLTAAELAELNARQRSIDEIQSIVEPYAAQHRDEFGGLYIDQKAGGILVALFTRDVGEHEAALRARLHPRAPFAVREVRWSERELRALQDRVAAEMGWFVTIGATVKSTSVDVVNNVVEVEISSANAEASQLVVDRFAAEGRMRVISDGTGVLNLARGAIVGRVVDAHGRAVAHAMVAPVPLFDAGPMDGVGYETRADGSFEVRDVPPGPWRIDVWHDSEVVASAEVLVPPGALAPVLVTLAEPLPEP